MKKTVSLLLLALLTSAAFCQSKHKIELNLKPSQTFQIYSATNQDITQTIMGNDQNVKTMMTGAMTFAVKEKLSDSYLLNVTIDSISMAINSSYMTMAFSSNKKDTEGDYFSQALAGLTGLTFELKIGKNGKIEEFKGVEDTLNSLISGFGIPEQNMEQLKGQLGQTFGDEAFKSSFETIFMIYPDKSVKTGESWNNKIELNTGINIILQNTWTLKDYKKDEYIIDESSVISTKDTASVYQLNGMPAKTNLTGEQTATYNLNSETGLIINGETNSTIKGVISIQKNPQVPDGIDVPIKIITKTTYKSL